MKYSRPFITLPLVCVIASLLFSCGSIGTSDGDSNSAQQVTALQQRKESKAKQLNLASHQLQRQHSMRMKTPVALGYMSPTVSFSHEENRENYNHFSDNGVFKSADNPVSTFSIDVDTGAYSNVRRFLNQGSLPQRDAVRAEELINYFSYSYAYPENQNQPFSISTEIAPTPWNKNSYLLHIGLQAYKSHSKQRPANNLVFLVDVSGSMHSKDKLSLLKSGLKLLVKNLQSQDRISIVTYAGSTAVVLKPTRGDKRSEIMMALNQLTTGGATNGASGIKLAYQMAQYSFIENGVNRIILATDGDFNLGVTDFEALKQIVETNRKSGVSLTTLGFGQGNYNDHLMERLADAGNGNYSYIDNLNEARKVLVEEMSSTLHTVASDVKIQIEFNPEQVSNYRLIGYENRGLKREDFNNDKVDAGEIGESHSVAALYEITFTGSESDLLDDNRYRHVPVKKETGKYINEIAFLRLRYKKSNHSQSQLIEVPLFKRQVLEDVSQASNNFKFAASVAAFAQQLRGGKYLRDFGYNDILKLAKKSKGDDEFGYRGEFIQLVSLAKALDT